MCNILHVHWLPAFSFWLNQPGSKWDRRAGERTLGRPHKSWIDQVRGMGKARDEPLAVGIGFKRDALDGRGRCAPGKRANGKGAIPRPFRLPFDSEEQKEQTS